MPTGNDPLDADVRRCQQSLGQFMPQVLRNIGVEIGWSKHELTKMTKCLTSEVVEDILTESPTSSVILGRTGTCPTVCGFFVCREWQAEIREAFLIGEVEAVSPFDGACYFSEALQGLP